MINKYKIIFIDIDDTLVPGKKGQEISYQNASALKKAQKRGYHIVLCTGRAFIDFNEIWKEININNYSNYVIGNTGSFIYQPAKDEYIYENIFTNESLEKLVNYVKDNKWPFLFSTSKTIYAKRRTLALSLILYFKKRNFKYYDDLVMDNLSPSNFRKFGFFSSWNKRAVMRSIEKMKIQLPDYEFATTGSKLYTEVTNKGVNKGSAAEKLCEHLKVDIKDCIAIGDSMNDMPILKKVGLSVVMNNASKEIKEQADIIIPSSKKHGVSIFIDSLLDLRSRDQEEKIIKFWE